MRAEPTKELIGNMLKVFIKYQKRKADIKSAFLSKYKIVDYNQRYTSHLEEKIRVTDVQNQVLSITRMNPCNNTIKLMKECFRELGCVFVNWGGIWYLRGICRIS